MELHKLYFLIFTCVFSFPALNAASCGLLRSLEWPYVNNIPFSCSTHSPVSINSTQTRKIKTKPRYLYVHVNRTDSVVNTGKAVEINTPLSDVGSWYTTGGVLGKKKYNYVGSVFVWNSDINSPAGTIVDGVSTPLDAVVNYVNEDYGTIENATSHRDGMAIVPVRVSVVEGPDNPLFDDLGRVLKSIAKAGTSAPLPRSYFITWLDDQSEYPQYFGYPGSYRDVDSGKQFDCATMIVRNLIPGPNISVSQFNDVFGSFLNMQGVHYDDHWSIAPRNGRPIVSTGPSIQVAE